MLFSKSAVPLRKIIPGPLNNPKLLTSLRCKGHESSVIECDQTSYNDQLRIIFSCTSESEYYGVFCGSCKTFFCKFMFAFKAFSLVTISMGKTRLSYKQGMRSLTFTSFSTRSSKFELNLTIGLLNLN